MAEHLTTSEFSRWAESLDRKIDKLQDVMDRRLDVIETRGIDHATKIAKLEVRCSDADTTTKRTAQGWGAGIGGAVAAIVAVIGKILGIF